MSHILVSNHAMFGNIFPSTLARPLNSEQSGQHSLYPLPVFIRCTEGGSVPSARKLGVDDNIADYPGSGCYIGRADIQQMVPYSLGKNLDKKEEGTIAVISCHLCI